MNDEEEVIQREIEEKIKKADAKISELKVLVYILLALNVAETTIFQVESTIAVRMFLPIYVIVLIVLFCIDKFIDKAL